MNDSLKKDYDVAIVGAGPAGSSAAISLALAGLSVLLVEQKKFPREKLCGEFISPECLSHFTELGVIDEITAARGAGLNETIFFSRNGKGVAVASEWFGVSGSLAIGLSRAAMDDLLLERARQTGVDIREDTTAAGLITVRKKVLGLKLKNKNAVETDVSAKLTIDATGRTRFLARRFEKGSRIKTPAKFVAFKTHLRGARIAAGACEIYIYRGGYGGCSRVENDLYNLCFIAAADDVKRLGSDPEKVMREVVFKNKRAAETMKNAETAKPWHAVPIERFGRHELIPAEGSIAVGDAAAFIDPFTGSGILLALESAKIASAAIISSFNDPFDFSRLATEYKKNYSSAFDTRLRVCSMLRLAAFVPFLAEATISALRVSTGLSRRIARATRNASG